MSYPILPSESFVTLIGSITFTSPAGDRNALDVATTNLNEWHARHGYRIINVETLTGRYWTALQPYPGEEARPFGLRVWYEVSGS